MATAEDETLNSQIAEQIVEVCDGIKVLIDQGGSMIELAKKMSQQVARIIHIQYIVEPWEMPGEVLAAIMSVNRKSMSVGLGPIIVRN